MASGIISDLGWYQKFHLVKKCASKALSRQTFELFLHEYENNTHEAEQALPAGRGAGRSSRGTRPLLSSSDGARSCRIPLRCLLQNTASFVATSRAEAFSTASIVDIAVRL